MSTRRSHPFATSACAALLLLACHKDKAKPAGEAPTEATKPTADQPATPTTAAGRIPITTKSAEARALYEQGWALQLALRNTDAHPLYEQAIAKDPDFALAYLQLANTSATNTDFFAALDKAVALAPKASKAEQLWIAGAQAGAKGDPDGALAAFKQLADAAPQDPQGPNLVGQNLMARQDYDGAIASFTKAIQLDPKFGQAYNQLGYANRFAGKMDDAEKAFQQYIAVTPNDPNPYDSYGELLMKRGKWDESIASYQKALAIDPNFVASYVGIGNDHMFAGRGDKAREAFGQLQSVARNPGEQRQALFWIAESYIHEGKWDDALASLDKEQAIAEKGGDLGLVAQDHNFRANILLESGKPDAAATEFKVQLDTIAKAGVPDEVKDQTKRNAIYDLGRVAVAKHDLATAKAKLDEYRTAVEAKKVPFEVRQLHELAGMVAIEDKKFADAVTELGQANQQDPRVLYLLGVAYAGAGDAAKAKAAYTDAYEFNALGGNYGFVRAKAKKAAGV